MGGCFNVYKHSECDDLCDEAICVMKGHARMFALMVCDVEKCSVMKCISVVYDVVKCLWILFFQQSLLSFFVSRSPTFGYFPLNTSTP